jgi:hypothetical protein
MSTAGEAKPSRGPKGAAPCDLGRPTRGRFAYWGWHEEADQ